MIGLSASLICNAENGRVNNLHTWKFHGFSYLFKKIVICFKEKQKYG